MNLKLATINGDRIIFPNINRNDLIDYCEVEINYSSRLYKEVIAQMIEYAGRPKGFPTSEEASEGDKDFYGLSDDIVRLVELARERGRNRNG